MRSWSFLLSRRWALFALVVVAIGYATWWLGGWQFGRLHDRKADNAIVRANEGRDPAPAEEVLTPGRQAAASDEWREVTASGVYRPEDTVVVRYRTRDGESGVDLVVPLVLDSGEALLVDRGWLPADNGGADLDRNELPAPPAGRVDVTGWVRLDGSGESTRVGDLSTRAISSEVIGPEIALPTLGGFVELDSETPGPAADQTALRAVELPELNNGPHFFYGLQWWFFGVLAVFGFFYLMYDEWRGGPRSARERPARRPVPARSAGPERPGRPARGPAPAVVRQSTPQPARDRKAARRAAIEAGLVKARAEKAEKAASKSR